MVRLIQISSKLRYLLVTSELTLLLLVMACASPEVQQKTEPVQTETKPANRITIFVSESGRENSYPDWFWNVPTSQGTLFAIGQYTTSTLHPENSYQKAVEDAVANLAKCLSVRVSGEYGMMRQGGRVVFSGHNMEEEVPADILTRVGENHKVYYTALFH